MIEVFVVILEDTYETRFGDGYFGYLAEVFRTRDEAAAFIDARRDGAYAFHLRPARFGRDATGALALIADQPDARERLGSTGDGQQTDLAALARRFGVA